MTAKHDAIEQLFAHTSLGAPENAVGFVLWRLVHRYQREIDRALAPLDLTHLQFTTLAMAAWLSRAREPVTQARLAQDSEISPMQVSHMIKTLEQKRLLTRVRGSEDTRVNHVSLTARGLELLAHAMPIAIEVQRAMFGAEGAPGGSLLKALRRAEKR